MKSRTGIIAAQDGKTIADDELAYDSTNGHLLVDSRTDVKHLDVYEGGVGNTAWSMNAGAESNHEEVFLEIYHKLPFIPRVSVYMLIRDAPVGMASFIGRYVGGFLSIGSGAFEENLFVRVDKEKVQFIRNAKSQNLGIPGLTYDSTFQAIKVRAKYMIFSNLVADEPYEIRLPFI